MNNANYYVDFNASELIMHHIILLVNVIHDLMILQMLFLLYHFESEHASCSHYYHYHCFCCYCCLNVKFICITIALEFVLFIFLVCYYLIVFLLHWWLNWFFHWHMIYHNYVFSSNNCYKKCCKNRNKKNKEWALISSLTHRVQ